MSGRSREEERREDGKNEEASADGTKQGELLTPLFVSALCEHARTRTPHSQRKCTSIHSSVYLPATCCEQGQKAASPSSRTPLSFASAGGQSIG